MKPQTQPLSFFDALQCDPLLSVPPEWRQHQIRDQARWTRRYLLPLLKIFTLAVVWCSFIVKRILPFHLGSKFALNGLSKFFLKRFVSPYGQEVIYRHFECENNLIQFVLDNCGDDQLSAHVIKPQSYRDMGQLDSENVTLLHDLNMLRFVVDLGTSKKANVVDTKPLQDLDFSAIQLSQYEIRIPDSGRIMTLDYESSLYIMVMFLALLLDEVTLESSVSSLVLDETLLGCIANLTGDPWFRRWSPSRFISIVCKPLNPARALQEHISLCEYAHTRLSEIKPACA